MLGRILIVEDEEAIAAFVQTALERDGFSVEWVGDGATALSALDSFRPDLVLLDLALPGMDGLLALSRLEASPPLMRIVNPRAVVERAFSHLFDRAQAAGLTLTLDAPSGLPRVRADADHLE
jgi:DNA-binding response OmpR family regulator